jgi:hypothetical protein
VAAHLWISTLQSQTKWSVYDTEAPVLHERMKRVLGERHAVTISVAAALADRLRSTGRFEEALPLSLVVVEVYEKRIGDEAMFTVMHRYALIQSLIGTGRLDAARDVLRKQHEFVDRKYTPDGYMAAITIAQQRWLAERDGDAEGVERWASRLRGTRYEAMLTSAPGQPGSTGHSDEPAPK